MQSLHGENPNIFLNPRRRVPPPPIQRALELGVQKVPTPEIKPDVVQCTIS